MTALVIGLLVGLGWVLTITLLAPVHVRDDLGFYLMLLAAALIGTAAGLFTGAVT